MAMEGQRRIRRLEDECPRADDRLHQRLRDGDATSFARVPSAGLATTALKLRLSMGLVAIVSLGIIFPLGAWVVGIAALLWLQAGLKLVGTASPLPRPAPLAASDEDLPLYTVLVPLYREANSVPGLLQSLRALDYPRECLRVLVLCEADDAATLEAVRREMDGTIRLIVVPAGGPRTKPNALCYALRRVREGLITIYDAEDRPDPSQLRAAVAAFRADPALVAVQAPLVVDNAAPGWITRQFALEYAALFFVWLPWLVRMRLPIPLGGTSNHVRVDALRRVGGWDAFNVTEDADLTYRLALDPAARFGWIAPPTSEEAVTSWRAWRRQRTRWMKGFLQTWLGHAFRGGGLRRGLSLQLAIGLTLLSGLLHLPVILALVALSADGFGASLASLVAALLGGALYGSGVWVVAKGARRAGRELRLRDALTLPLYWLLLTIPTWIAVWELIVKPHHWSKTEHAVAARTR